MRSAGYLELEIDNGAHEQRVSNLFVPEVEVIEKFEGCCNTGALRLNPHLSLLCFISARKLFHASSK